VQSVIALLLLDGREFRLLKFDDSTPPLFAKILADQWTETPMSGNSRAVQAAA
jgi:hypothetical protein